MLADTVAAKYLESSPRLVFLTYGHCGEASYKYSKEINMTFLTFLFFIITVSSFVFLFIQANVIADKEGLTCR